MATEELSRATRVMAVGTVLSRVTGFGRLFALAYAFGFTRLTDTYNLANTTPNIIYELVLGGVLSGTLVPVFVRLLKEGDRPTDRDSKDADGVSAIVTMAVVVITALAALLALAAPLVIRLYTVGNDSPAIGAQRDVGTTLLRLFAPQVACLGVITITTALLNARRRFAAPMYAPVLANLTIIGVLLSMPTIADQLTLAGMQRERSALLVLGLGTTAAFVVQAVVQVLALRGTGLRLRPRWDLAHPAVRQVVRLSGWTVGFTIANQVALWVVLVLAGRANGGVSAYQAGLVFFQLPHAVVTVSVMTALLPALSRRWSDDDRAGFARETSWGLRAAGALIVPAAIGYVVLARPLVTVVLEHGALSSADARLTGDVLALLALGLPGFSAFLLLVRSFYALQDTRSVFWLYVVENGLNIALAVALFPGLGVRGLALAYAVAYTATAVAAGVLLRQRLKHPLLVGARPWAIKLVVATGLMAAAVVGVTRVSRGGGGLSAAVEAGAGIGAGVSVYLLAATALGVEELRQLLRPRRSTT